MAELNDNPAIAIVIKTQQGVDLVWNLNEPVSQGDFFTAFGQLLRKIDPDKAAQFDFDVGVPVPRPNDPN